MVFVAEDADGWTEQRLGVLFQREFEAFDKLGALLMFVRNERLVVLLGSGLNRLRWRH